MSFGWDDLGRIGEAIATGGASELARAVEGTAAAGAGAVAAVAGAAAAAAGAAAPAAQGQPAGQAPAGQYPGVICCFNYEGGPGRPAGQAPAGPAPAVVCCSRYRIEGQFLLDTQCGRVWRYDDAKKEFLLVTKESSAIEKSWVHLFTAKLTSDVVNSLTDAAKTSTFAEYSRVGPLVAAHIKAMDDHLKVIRPT